ncbi:hypothetical protein [Pseudorhodoplanes sinuspersici]|uniref:Uncharacterized protein n=1 Tax=Pseudorhodoplanes sinuspersici TaxID=1235591 RepID=A0A1W6ZVE4_9HYPH|nr:hypothetical protein [Pseudorhodoplanes sinuspersici]ARQ01276.1 hypothetical protein CAK95_20880 [Pseudorhodoplanes sinuspersici]RKE72953.1 hypothetical protein DFP91_0826 [Pseudorhodoplanes sinuspersici]
MIRAARRTFFSVIVLGSLAGLTPALAQGLDTATLPRVAGAKLTYAGPASTIYTTSGSVAQAAEAVVRALAAAGWQTYGDPFSQSAPDAPQRIMTFKKGAQAIVAFVTAAPAQGNATSVSYSANALANDLPFPKDATEIGFAPERPHLRAVSGETVAALLDFFRKDMAALGYQPWAGKPEQVSEKGALTFFTRDNQKILVLSLTRNDEGRTRIDITPTTARVLTAEQRQTPPAETPEQARAKAAAREQHERASAAIDAQINAQIDNVLRDVQQSLRAPAAPAAKSDAPVTVLRAKSDNAAPVPVPESADDVAFNGDKGELEFMGGPNVRSLAAFYKAEMTNAGWSTRKPTIDRDNMVVLDFTKGGQKLSFTIMQFGQGVRVRASGSGLVTAAAQPPGKTAAAAKVTQQFNDDDLTAEDVAGHPVPKRRTASGSERTQYRVVLNATVPMDVATMLAFYRRELTARGWSEAQGASVSEVRSQAAFTAPEGPAVLTLERKGNDTQVRLALRKPEVAQKAGVLPKPGQAKVLIGNPGDSEAVVTINKQTFRVKPGAGAKNPDGPMLDLAPGQYQVSLKIGGRSERETITVGADEAWGLIIGPGGLLPLHVY